MTKAGQTIGFPKFLLLVLLPILVVASVGVTGFAVAGGDDADNVVVYSNDFEGSAGPEWSNTFPGPAQGGDVCCVEIPEPSMAAQAIVSAASEGVGVGPSSDRTPREKGTPPLAKKR